FSPQFDPADCNAINEDGYWICAHWMYDSYAKEYFPIDDSQVNSSDIPLGTVLQAHHK
ncbi:unnamed protein product, partial [Trichobilharzia szidati]